MSYGHKNSGKCNFEFLDLFFSFFPNVYVSTFEKCSLEPLNIRIIFAWISNALRGWRKDNFEVGIRVENPKRIRQFLRHIDCQYSWEHLFPLSLLIVSLFIIFFHSSSSLLYLSFSSRIWKLKNKKLFYISTHYAFLGNNIFLWLQVLYTDTPVFYIYMYLYLYSFYYSVYLFDHSSNHT